MSGPSMLPAQMSPADAQEIMRQTVGEELFRPCHPAVLAMTGEIRERHGKTVAAMLFYGSCLRHPADANEAPEGLLDFYVIVDRYEDAYESRLQAAANRLLPPTVFYLEIPWRKTTVRAKYAVMSMAAFRRAVSSRARHPSIWARFAQPAMLPYGRDEQSRRLVEDALIEAIATMAGATAPLLASSFEPGALWSRALQETYRTELRPESGNRPDSIYQSDKARYDRLTRPALTLSGLDVRAGDVPAGKGGLLQHRLDAKARGQAERRWRWRRLIGKPLTILRLMKSVFTFDGGVDYARWKIERHTGLAIPLTPFERRHPILNAPRLLWRLYRMSAVR